VTLTERLLDACHIGGEDPFNFFRGVNKNNAAGAARGRFQAESARPRIQVENLRATKIYEVLNGRKHGFTDALAGWPGGALWDVEPEGPGLTRNDSRHLSTVSDEEAITCVPCGVWV